MVFPAFLYCHKVLTYCSQEGRKVTLCHQKQEGSQGSAEGKRRQRLRGGREQRGGNHRQTGSSWPLTRPAGLPVQRPWLARAAISGEPGHLRARVFQLLVVGSLTTANAASGGGWGSLPPGVPLGAASDPKPRDLADWCPSPSPVPAAWARRGVLSAFAIQPGPRASCLKDRPDKTHWSMCLPPGRTGSDCPQSGDSGLFLQLPTPASPGKPFP